MISTEFLKYNIKDILFLCVSLIIALCLLVSKLLYVFVDVFICFVFLIINKSAHNIFFSATHVCIYR